MQNDYIRRETAIKALCTVSAPTPTESWIVEKCIERVNEQPAADVLDVDKAMRFIEDYAFKDEKEVYTNGTVLVPLFRVKQALVDKAYNGFFGEGHNA